MENIIIKKNLKPKSFILLCMCAISFGLSALLLTKKLPLSLPGHQLWVYRDFNTFPIEPYFIVVSILFGLCIVFIPLLHERISHKWLLLGLAIITIFLNLFISRPISSTWTQRVIATTQRQINPFFHAGVYAPNIKEYVSMHKDVMQQNYWDLPPHLRRLTGYPLGLPVIYYVIGKAANVHPDVSKVFSDISMQNVDSRFGEMKSLPKSQYEAAAAYLAILVHLLFIGLIPVSVYALAKMLLDNLSALRIAVISCLIPSFHLFVTMPDIVYPVLSLMMTMCAVTGVRRGNWILLYMSGLLGMAWLFLSFAFLPVFLICFLMIVLSLESARSLLKNLTSFLAGIFSGFLGLLMCKINLAEYFFSAMKSTGEYKADVAKGYWESIIFNAWEFMVFTGFMVLLIWGWNLFKLLKAPNELRGSGIFNIALGVTFILLLLSGVVRGEVAREFMFLMPLFVVGAFSNYKLSRRESCIISLFMLYALILECALIEVTFGVF